MQKCNETDTAGEEPLRLCVCVSLRVFVCVCRQRRFVSCALTAMFLWVLGHMGIAVITRQVATETKKELLPSLFLSNTQL